MTRPVSSLVVSGHAPVDPMSAPLRPGSPVHPERRAHRAPVDAGAPERLARVARGLADPIRLRMLEMMIRGRGCCGLVDLEKRGVPGDGEPVGICVCEFQAQFGLAQSKASYHLRVLKGAGLVTEEIRGKWRFYSVDGGRVAEALRAFHVVLGVEQRC